MKHIYKIVFLFVLLTFNASSVYSSTKVEKSNLIKTVANLSGNIAGNATVCMNATQPQLITFTGSGGTAPYTFTYHINNGSPQTVVTSATNSSVTVVVSTSNAGTFIYNLDSLHDATTPITEQASSGSATVNISLPPVVDFTFTNDNSCMGTAIQFSSTVTAGPYNYSWDFGDGTSSTQQNPSHSFVSLGCTNATFNVSLTVTGGGCTVTKTKTVTVKQKPDISFIDIGNQFDPFSNCGNASSNSTYSISVGNTSASTCISSFSINWGDGNTQANIAFPISHTYSSIGAYSMTITATGVNGCVNSKTYIIKNVSNPLGGLNSPGSTQNLCAPTPNLQFSISNWGTNSLDTTYKIDYGDGSPIITLTQNQLNSSTYYNSSSPSNSANYPIPHIYTSTSCPATSFEVKLDVTNACGTTPFTLGNISILTKPTANFTAPVNSCSNTSVLFTNTTISGYGQNCVQGSIYKWNFGDGTPIITTPISSPQNINHTYTNSGTYTVTLTAENGCGTTTKMQTICIEPPLTPQFTLNNNAGCIPMSVTATNTTVTTTSCTTPTYIWSVAHSPAYCGTSISTIPNQTTTNASFNFTQPGTYTITLTASNSCSPPQVTSQTVTVKKQPIVSISPITSLCQAMPNNTISPTVTSTPTNCGTQALTYLWSFPGGIPATSTAAVPGTISYATIGTFTVSLSVTNECGTTVAGDRTFSINPSPTISGTLFSCVGSTSQLTGSATAAATSPWGSSITTVATVSSTGLVTGKSAGTTTITYTNSVGCQTTALFTVNPSPTATISGNTSVCLNSAAQITFTGANGISPYIFTYNVNGGTHQTITTTSGNSALLTLPNSSVGTFIYNLVSISDSSPTNCSKVQTGSATVIVNSVPTISIQPTPTQSICVGGTITALNVSFTGGAGTATYQWYSNASSNNSGGTLITGGTNSSYTPATFNAVGSLYYYAVVTFSGSGCGTATSLPAEVVVVADPTLTTQPLATQPQCQNATPTDLSVVASGGVGTFNYQWYSNTANNTTGGTAIGTAISSTYTPPTNTVGTKYYYCILTQTGLGCSVTSTMAAVIVVVAPAINPQPLVSQSVCLNGSTSALTVGYTNGTGTPSYQWYSNTTNSNSGGTPIATATTGSFTPNSTAVGTIYYYCTVTFPSGGCSLITSNTAAVIVNALPTISTQPLSTQSICIGGTIAPLSIVYIGGVGTASYQWYSNTSNSVTGGTPISGATGVSYTPTAFTVIGNNYYYVTVTLAGSGCGNTTSAVAEVVVVADPILTTQPLATQPQCQNATPTDLSVVASGGVGTFNYQWYSNTANNTTGGTVIGTAISSTYTPPTNTVGTKYYYCILTQTGLGCSVTSTTAAVIVVVAPAINPQPLVSQSVCLNGSTSALTVGYTNGTGTPSYQWYSNTTNSNSGGTPIANATSGSFTPNSTAVGTIYYYCTVTFPSGGCSLITSNTAAVNVNAYPSITTPQAQTICSTTSFSITPIDDGGNTIPAGTTYSWGIPIVTGGITGGTALANQTTIKGTLINSTNDVQTATYTITPKSGTCTGTSFTAVITVNPSPKVQFSAANQTICSGSASLPITLSTLTSGNVTFNWTATIPAGITGATASGTDTIPIQTLINLSTTPLTVIYTAIATFENNGISCSGPTLDYKITVNPAIITSSILSNYNGFNVSSVGANDGAINVTVTGGSGTYTYLWSGPSGFPLTMSQDILNVPAGAYSLTINDVLCNPVVLNFNLTSPLPLLIKEDTAAQIDVLCFGYLTGAIKVDITQQSIGPYDYLLTLQGGGTISSIINATSTNYTFTSLAAGIYDIKVTDANGSSKTILGIEITQPSGISASISYPSNISCAGSATGSATVTATGGIGTLTYSWNTNPIQTTETASGLIAGTYTVTITDANNCSIQKQAVITEPNGIVASITSLTNVLCFGNNTGSATVSATGGTGVSTYSWDTVPIQTTVTATGLVAGTYKVTITDANGCSNVRTALITQPLAGLSAMISNSTNVSCFGGNNGNATVAVTGGTSPYTYSWNTNPIQTSVTATGLTAGTYNVTVTDSNGCSISSPITITEPVGMSATMSAQTDVFCSGNSSGSATVSANGGTAPYGYSWNTTPVQTSDTATNLAIGTYTATITDANGCTTTTQATITEPNGIVVSIASQTNVKCFGNNTGSVSVLASGGTGILTYSWDTIPVQTSLNATGLIAGTYHLTITDANNCTKVQTVNITQPDDISITTDLEKDITCFNDANGEIKITISGGTLNYNYTWTKDGIPYATTEDLTQLSPGIYMVTVSDANNCGPKTATFTITEPPILTVSLLSQTNILCYGEATGAIEIAVVGGTPTLSGYNFVWTGPNGFTSSNKNLTAVISGTYNVLVTDNSGCSKALSVTLTQPTTIILSATTTPIICYGSNDASITLAINGGVTPYTIVWSNLGGGTFQDNLSAGDYLITVTDANNCVKTLNVNIPEAPIFTINPVVKNISCFGAQDGSINLNIIGGITPVKLVWDDNAVAGNIRNNLGPGSYTVTIVDSKPCTIKRTFIILEPQPLILSANTTNAFDCDNANSGAINLLVAGGTPPFTYSWSNGSTTEDLVNIPAGNYLVTVIDSRGCSKQAQYSINRPPPIVIGVATKTEFDCETKFVKQTFVAQVSGGVPPYQLAWSSGTVSGSNNEMMNTSQNGTAILYVTDALGCKANYSFNVKLQSLGTPSFNATSYSFVTYGTYSIIDPIQFTNTATGDFISMVWDFGDGSFSTEVNPVHTFLNPKEYVVTQTVTYSFGCVYVQKNTFNVEKGYLFVVPTAFTPNNDTMNDTFRPVTKALKNVRLDIYDTWGSLIYSETGDTLKGWDGKIKGQNAENGNYYCKVSAETFYGTIVNENHPFVLIK
ncbi:gliding motility-associated-like protein [Flavobacterium sp. CG_9.10]|uniref:PKD domain-containing protein n=1 Tax=Flavobacterium sp. CG_9.10 TaxID=2787729 RepID=UPI0018C90D7A|nr:PKD domain-containing protein [Flavobacterium sp. CG_9.10]MBG6111013.1 gliding motility-associated-like protein [Flavobacterium sp. CG_9.10]